MPKIIGDVELYMGPIQTGAPGDLELAIVSFIDGAQKRLDVAVQELDSPPIAYALVKARQRRVLVKVVIEHDYLREPRALMNPATVGGSHEVNRDLHAMLLRANIDVKTDYNTSIFHQKFIVRDRQSLLTGSTNFTQTGTERNLNHLVIIHDAVVAKTYAREFSEISKGHFGKRNDGHNLVPEETVVSGIPIKVLFAPDHNPEMEIMKQMAKAKKRVDFAIFTFSQSSGIDDQMLLLRRIDMPLRGVMDLKQGVQRWSASHTLAEAGVELHTVAPTNIIGKLHHKLMVMDRQVIIAGSFNYTNPANTLNDENIIILGDLETTDEASIQQQKDLAKYALNEIERIIETHGSKYSPR
ncbi:MAG: phospholipase D-like domain-containing protein [Cyanobacteria bacterium P01_E01_bin.6]